MTKKIENMSSADKRVAIAKDVIKHINTIEVTAGTYLEDGGNYDQLIVDEFEGEDPDCKRDAKEYIDQLSEGCQVCALGACFLSSIRLFDNFKLRDFGRGVNRDDMTSLLATAFDDEAMDKIEHVFEGGELAEEIFDKTEDNERLKLIMQNIVDNKGVFKPAQIAKKLEKRKALDKYAYSSW